MRRHLTYANVVSTLCLFVVLGGTSYAVTSITGKNVKNGSLTGADIRDNSIKSADVSGLRVKDFKGALRAGERGPEGPRGATGAAGATRVIVRTGSPAIVSNNSTNNAFAACNAGERAIGGGGQWVANVSQAMSIVQSAPSGGGGTAAGEVPTQWAVTGGNTSGSDKQVQAWVVCASP